MSDFTKSQNIAEYMTDLQQHYTYVLRKSEIEKKRGK